MKQTENPLSRVYSEEAFQRDGHKLIDIIAAELKNSRDTESPHTIRWQSPEEQLRFWQDELSGPALPGCRNWRKKFYPIPSTFTAKAIWGIR